MRLEFKKAFRHDFSMTKSFKILYAEDESALREIMTELLEAEGYKVFSVKNGLEAKNLLAQERFDLLMTDFQMPHLTGHDLLFWCRENNYSLPVIFLTASLDKIPVEELALKDSRSSILYKPVGIETLVRAIDRAIKCETHLFVPEASDEDCLTSSSSLSSSPQSFGSHL